MANDPLNFPFAIRVADDSPSDPRYGIISGGVWRPYADKAEALANVPIGMRYEGLIVRIGGDEYHWKDGRTDADLILKSNGGPGSASNGLSKDGNDIKLGGSSLSDRTVIGGDSNVLSLGDSDDKLYRLDVYASDNINISSDEAVNIIGDNGVNLNSFSDISIQGTNSIGISSYGSVSINGQTGLSLNSSGGIYSANKHSFSPSIGGAGINVGTIPEEPLVVNDGDVWYNSTTHKFRGGVDGESVDFLINDNKPQSGPFILQSCTTSTLPPASSHKDGILIYDTGSFKKLIFSDGSEWRNANGTSL